MLVFVTCISCSWSFAQDTKWEITPLKSVKKGMGRLNLQFPDSVVWSVDLYSSNNKFITNRSYKDKRNESDKSSYYDLPVGYYHLKLNAVPVQNVPIEEGRQTRVKAGLLEINENLWELRTDPAKKFLTSGNAKKKMMLPIGNYQLGKANTYRVVTITDLIGTGDLTTTIDPEVSLSPYYDIKDGPESLEENGRIEIPLYPVSVVVVDFETGAEIQTNWADEKVAYFIKVKSVSGMETLATGDSSITIAPGQYAVYVNEVHVQGKVLVSKGKITTIKAGFLKITKGDQDRAFGFIFPDNSYGPRLYHPFVMVIPVLPENKRYLLNKYKKTSSGSMYDYNEIHSYIPEIKEKQLTINGKKDKVVVKTGMLD